MSKIIKIGIAGVNPFNGNRGVGALAYSTVYLLSEIAKEQNIHIELFIISNNIDEYTLYYENENIKIKNITPFTLFKLSDWIKLLIKTESFNSFIKYYRLNFILLMGEGDSFSDIYGEIRFKSINGQFKLANFFKKKYALLPQTIGPFKNKHVRNSAIKSIENAKLVFTRDFQSYNYVLENSKQKNIFEITDVAFFMHYKKHEFDNNQIHVGLNISALLWNGGYTENNQFNLRSNYKVLNNLIIEFFLSIPNLTIHIVPHVVLQKTDLENDYEISYQLVNSYANERIVLAPFFLTPIFAKNYIAGMDFFIGARMHSVIAGFSSEVPVFPLAYSRKFNGLFIDTLDYSYMGDLKIQTENEIIEDIKNAFSNRKNLKKIVQERMNNVLKIKINLFKKQIVTFITQ